MAVPIDPCGVLSDTVDPVSRPFPLMLPLPSALIDKVDGPAVSSIGALMVMLPLEPDVVCNEMAFAVSAADPVTTRLPPTDIVKLLPEPVMPPLAAVSRVRVYELRD